MDNFVEARKDVLSWDETFMALALVMKERSKDPSTQVGACVVGADNRILSLGYNGLPKGFDDQEFNWARDGELLETKYPYVVHAERNAVLNFRGSLREFEGSTLYTTHFPCSECAKEISQVGVERVVYLNAKNNKGMSGASVQILEQAGVLLVQFNNPDFSVQVAP